MAKEEKIPEYFIRVPDEKLIQPAIEYLSIVNDPKRSTEGSSQSGGGIVKSGSTETLAGKTTQQKIDRAALLLNEIQAGNDSPTVREEAKKLMDHLYKNKIIPEQKYLKIKANFKF